MPPNSTDFVINRLEEIAQDLRKTNGNYALAVRTREELKEKIDPVITSGREMTLDACDFMDIQEFLEYDLTATAIEQQAFYKQGYLDCVDLLKELGMLR